MTESAPEPKPESRSGQPTSPELLAQALEHLSSDERQQVTAWLLARPTTSTVSGRRATPELLHAFLPGPETFRELAGARSGREQQVVPVRLPADLHSRLRKWCTEHGFSMATVVRGLVGRFLDDQAPVAEADRPPAS